LVHSIEQMWLMIKISAVNLANVVND